MPFLRPLSIGIYFKGKEFAPLEANSFFLSIDPFLFLSIDPFLEGLCSPEKVIRKSLRRNGVKHGENIWQCTPPTPHPHPPFNRSNIHQS